jgi:hypothetical protein
MPRSSWVAWWRRRDRDQPGWRANLAGLASDRSHATDSRRPASGLGDLQIVGLATRRRYRRSVTSKRDGGRRAFDDSQACWRSICRRLADRPTMTATGWDDRLLGLILLFGPFQPFAKGEVTDSDRPGAQAIYVATEQSPDDNLPFLIVQMCKKPICWRPSAGVGA